MVIVVRYFGGIKLGAGGLTRAYGQAAQAVMEVLPITEQVEMTAIDVTCDFALEKQVRHFIDEGEGKLDSVDYSNQVTLHIQLPTSNIDTFCQHLEQNRCSFHIPS